MAGAGVGPRRNRVVVVAAPARTVSPSRPKRRWRPSIKAAGEPALTAYVDTVSATPLLEPLPKPGSVAKTDIEAAGITEWTLSNGVRVVLQPTTFKQDEILFRAFSPGGTSLAADADFIAAETADEIVAQAVSARSARST